MSYSQQPQRQTSRKPLSGIVQPPPTPQQLKNSALKNQANVCILVAFVLGTFVFVLPPIALLIVLAVVGYVLVETPEKRRAIPAFVWVALVVSVIAGTAGTIHAKSSRSPAEGKPSKAVRDYSKKI